jgi:RNA polymerase sigma factor FliA
MARRTPLARNGVCDADDLEQDAALGVVQAARSFDSGRGNRFATHAYRRARGAVLDGQRALDHVPRSWRAAQRRVLRARTALVADLAREPSPAELAERLGMSIQEVRDVEERCLPPSSLMEPLPEQSPDGDELTAADMVADEERPPDELVAAREHAEALHAAIALLPARQQFAIRATWFLDVPANEVADLLGVSSSRMSQLRAEAMERLAQLVAELDQAA